MKELLDLLEERVSVLLEETRTLRQENKRLLLELTNTSASLKEENRMLREALAREQSVKETATQRIDARLSRLKERLPE
jgi:cell division septum initiation protein DivIVA